MGGNIQMDPFSTSAGAPKLTARLVTVGRVLSEMHISLKKPCTDLFQSLYACGRTRDPKQHNQIRGKVLFSYYVSFNDLNV